MASLQEILALVAQGESETLEFKASTANLASGMQTLCGMLNARGGRLLFGVDPSGNCAGQSFSDSTLQDIQQSVRDISPSIQPSIGSVELESGRRVISIRVESGFAKPYAFRGLSYLRVGSSTVRMDGDSCQRMLLERVHGENRWENQAAEGWSLDELDLALLEKSFAKAVDSGRLTDPGKAGPMEKLRHWGLVRDGRILRAAAILFGRQDHLRARMPQSRLKFARFSGADRGEFLDNRVFHGNSLELLDLASRLLRENLPLAGRIEPDLFERKDDPLYPPVALRETLANAFCHRDYSFDGNGVSLALHQDRLEVISDGELHFGVTADSLTQPHESRPWNPLMAGVFYDIGLIEQWGRGTLKIMELAERAGLAAPEFAEISGCLRVTLRATRYEPPKRVASNLTESQRKILSSLSQFEDGAALRELIATMAASHRVRQVKADLALLQSLRLIRSKGHGRGAKWTLISD